MSYQSTALKLFAASIVSVVLALPATSVRANTCSDSGPVPTYGAFAAGTINNSYGLSSCEPGANDTGYYAGTDNNNYTYQNSPAQASASGSVGTAQWGLSSASANLATGDLAVSTTSVGNPPNSSNPPPFGSPAGATAGIFVQLVFSGGQGQQGSVSMGGRLDYSGNVSASASLNIFQGGYPGLLGGYDIKSGTDLPATVGEAWSYPTQNFTINDGITYTLVAFINAQTSSSFLPGSLTITDPLVLNLPDGVTYTASYPGFLTADVSATPLPAALPLFGSGLGLIGLIARRRKRKSSAANV